MSNLPSRTTGEDHATNTTESLLVERVAILSQGDFFSSLPMHVLAAVVKASHYVALGSGDIVMSEGEHGDCMFAILAGSVEITVEGKAIRHCSSGDVLGDLGLLVPGLRSATAVCAVASGFLRIDAPVLDELLLDYPEIGSGIIASLVRRLRVAGDTNA